MLPDRSFSELYGDEVSSDPVTQTRARNGAVERRAAPRVTVETDVVIATEGQFLSGISVDLSPRGIFIATHRVLEVGAHVSLEFALSDGQALARGVVRWVRRGGDGEVPGVGVEFSELPAVDRELIVKFCEAPRFYTPLEGNGTKAASSNN